MTYPAPRPTSPPVWPEPQGGWPPPAQPPGQPGQPGQPGGPTGEGPPPHMVPSPPWPDRLPEPPLPPRPRSGSGRSWATTLGAAVVVVAIGATLTVAAVSAMNPAGEDSASPTTTEDDSLLPTYVPPVEGASPPTEEGGKGAGFGEWDPQVTDLVDFVEQTRGLKFDHPVPVDYLTPEQFSASVREADAPTEADREAVEADVAYLQGFGLVDQDVDLVAIEADLADVGTVGYYDELGDRIVVRGTELTPDVQGTLVHELTHALQAQHFDPGAGAGAAESDVALEAVSEGDAMRVEDEWVFTLDQDQFAAYQQSIGDVASEFTAAAADLPPILAARDAAAYTLGPQLVDALAASGGNAAVDDAFVAPPTSTEQLLDPEAYLDADEPMTVEGPVLPASVSGVGEPFTLGAYELYLVLATRVGPVDAFDAVTGWGGDTTVTYQQGSRPCVAVAARGDTAADDAELRAAFDAWATAGPSGGARVAEGPGGATTLLSCTTAPDTDAAAVTTDPLDSLTLLDSRAFFTWEAMTLEGAELDDALARSDCLVHTLPLDTLAVLGGSEEAPAEAQDALDGAKAGCGG